MCPDNGFLRDAALCFYISRAPRAAATALCALPLQSSPRKPVFLPSRVPFGLANFWVFALLPCPVFREWLRPRSAVLSCKSVEFHESGSVC